MRRQFLLGVLLLLLLRFPPTLSAAQPSSLRFIVQVLPLSNLVYQLDCLSGIMHCSQEVYLNLWKTQLDWTAEDQAELSRWRLLREKYRGEIALNEPTAEPMALPWNGPTGMQLEEKFSIASFHAPDDSALRSHWEVIVAPTDLPRLESIIAHFEPRFSGWWRADAQNESERFRQTLQDKLDQKTVRGLIQSFARFYDTALPDDYPIYLNLFFRPASGNAHTNGTQFENHAVVEFLPSEDAGLRLSVVIHELCHFFYTSGTDAHRRALSLSFANLQDPFSLAGWNILNEALATALGNGIAAETLLDPAVFKKRLESDRGFYNDAAIDAAAKAILPLLQNQMAAGKILYDPGFAGSYMSALEQKMPELLQMPARLLTELVIIHDQEFHDVVSQSIRRNLSGGIYPYEGIASDESWTMLKTYPKMNCLILVSPATLPLLAERRQWVPPRDLDAMKRQFGKSKSWVYAIRRFPSTYLFVIGGKSSDDIAEAFQRLLAAKQRFHGFLRD
jgi:hypothetical protein